MEKLIIKTGDRYSRLTIIKEINSAKRRRFLCRCDCGIIKEINLDKLIGGKTVSCGCERKKAKHLVKINKKHGYSGTRQYNIWAKMIVRCNDKKCSGYKDYGGRGITVCKQWLKFENFWNDMGEKYKNSLTLDRINNDGGYSKENCRWANSETQMNNRRDNYFITHNQITKTIAQWERILGFNKDIIRQRILRYNWSEKRALMTPVNNN